jgi:hypothetical protein
MRDLLFIHIDCGFNMLDMRIVIMNNYMHWSKVGIWKYILIWEKIGSFLTYN